MHHGFDRSSDRNDRAVGKRSLFDAERHVRLEEVVLIEQAVRPGMKATAVDRQCTRLRDRGREDPLELRNDSLCDHKAMERPAVRQDEQPVPIDLGIDDGLLDAHAPQSGSGRRPRSKGQPRSGRIE